MSDLSREFIDHVIGVGSVALPLTPAHYDRTSDCNNESNSHPILTRVRSLNGNRISSFFHTDVFDRFLERVQRAEGRATKQRSNFIIDTTTAHGDAILTESSVRKPALGWVTVHVTEPLRHGIHEWAIKVENHGETNDGSGLMLGIVPVKFDRYDSFISQGGGWCLSRAGKFYGHWRRIDTNTAVSSLVFGTGDTVIFKLDIEGQQMTVRVGDKYVIGELSNISGDVFPAVSLHYRHQHVKFEYHRVRDRMAKSLSWTERWCFPNAHVYLPLDGYCSTTIQQHGYKSLMNPNSMNIHFKSPLTDQMGEEDPYPGIRASALMELPLNSYLFHPSIMEVIQGTQLPQQSDIKYVDYATVYARQFYVYTRAVEAALPLFRPSLRGDGGESRLYQAPFNNRNRYTTSTCEELRRISLPYSNSISGGISSSMGVTGVSGFSAFPSSFGADCVALVLLQILNTPSLMVSTLLSSAPAMVDYLTSGPLFKLRETLVATPDTVHLSSSVLSLASDKILLLLTPGNNSSHINLTVEHKVALAEILMIMAVQRGLVGECARAAMVLLRLHEELEQQHLSQRPVPTRDGGGLPRKLSETMIDINVHNAKPSIPPSSFLSSSTSSWLRRVESILKPSIDLRACFPIFNNATGFAYDYSVETPNDIIDSDASLNPVEVSSVTQDMLVYDQQRFIIGESLILPPKGQLPVKVSDYNKKKKITEVFAISADPFQTDAGDVASTKFATYFMHTDIGLSKWCTYNEDAVSGISPMGLSDPTSSMETTKDKEKMSATVMSAFENEDVNSSNSSVYITTTQEPNDAILAGSSNSSSSIAVTRNHVLLLRDTTFCLAATEVWQKRFGTGGKHTSKNSGINSSPSNSSEQDHYALPLFIYEKGTLTFVRVLDLSIQAPLVSILGTSIPSNGHNYIRTPLAPKKGGAGFRQKGIVTASAGVYTSTQRIISREAPDLVNVQILSSKAVQRENIESSEEFLIATQNVCTNYEHLSLPYSDPKRVPVDLNKIHTNNCYNSSINDAAFMVASKLLFTNSAGKPSGCQGLAVFSPVIVHCVSLTELTNTTFNMHNDPNHINIQPPPFVLSCTHPMDSFCSTLTGLSGGNSQTTCDVIISDSAASKADPSHALRLTSICGPNPQYVFQSNANTELVPFSVSNSLFRAFSSCSSASGVFMNPFDGSGTNNAASGRGGYHPEGGEEASLSYNRHPLPDPNRIYLPQGHVTIELWFRLTGRGEQKILYQHGNKATGEGEVFIELAPVDGLMCIRGGYRHETRGTYIVVRPLPMADGMPNFHHVALVFDGRWKLYINQEDPFIYGGSHGNKGSTSNTSAVQVSVERPFAEKWSACNGLVGEMCELRVWRGARSLAEISRDCHHYLPIVATPVPKATWYENVTTGLLAGDGSSYVLSTHHQTSYFTYCHPNPDLLCYYPMDERQGDLIYDYSIYGRHLVILRGNGRRCILPSVASTSGVGVSQGHPITGPCSITAVVKHKSSSLSSHCQPVCVDPSLISNLSTNKLFYAEEGVICQELIGNIYDMNRSEGKQSDRNSSDTPDKHFDGPWNNLSAPIIVGYKVEYASDHTYAHSQRNQRNVNQLNEAVSIVNNKVVNINQSSGNIRDAEHIATDQIVAVSDMHAATMVLTEGKKYCGTKSRGDGKDASFIFRRSGLYTAIPSRAATSSTVGGCTVSEVMRLSLISDDNMSDSLCNTYLFQTSIKYVQEFAESGHLAGNNKLRPKGHTSNSRTGSHHFSIFGRSQYGEISVRRHLIDTDDWACSPLDNNGGNTEGSRISLRTAAFAVLSLVESCTDILYMPTSTSSHYMRTLSQTSSPLFSPLSKDVSISSLRAILALIKDHFRQLQVRHAPKATSLRSPDPPSPEKHTGVHTSNHLTRIRYCRRAYGDSSVVIKAALSALDIFIQVVKAYKIHPASIGLVVDLMDEREGISTHSLSNRRATPATVRKYIFSGGTINSTRRSSYAQNEIGDCVERGRGGEGNNPARCLILSDGIDEVNSPTYDSLSSEYPSSTDLFAGSSMAAPLMKILAEILLTMPSDSTYRGLSNTAGESLSRPMIPFDITFLAAKLVRDSVVLHFPDATARAVLLKDMLHHLNTSSSVGIKLPNSDVSPSRQLNSHPNVAPPSLLSSAAGVSGTVFQCILLEGIIDTFSDVEEAAEMVTSSGSLLRSRLGSITSSPQNKCTNGQLSSLPFPSPGLMVSPSVTPLITPGKYCVGIHTSPTQYSPGRADSIAATLQAMLLRECCQKSIAGMSAAAKGISVSFTPDNMLPNARGDHQFLSYLLRTQQALNVIQLLLFANIYSSDSDENILSHEDQEEIDEESSSEFDVDKSSPSNSMTGGDMLSRVVASCGAGATIGSSNANERGQFSGKSGSYSNDTKWSINSISPNILFSLQHQYSLGGHRISRLQRKHRLVAFSYLQNLFCETTEVIAHSVRVLNIVSAALTTTGMVVERDLNENYKQAENIISILYHSVASAVLHAAIVALPLVVTSSTAQPCLRMLGTLQEVIRKLQQSCEDITKSLVKHHQQQHKAHSNIGRQGVKEKYQKFATSVADSYITPLAGTVAAAYAWLSVYLATIPISIPYELRGFDALMSAKLPAKGSSPPSLPHGSPGRRYLTQSLINIERVDYSGPGSSLLPGEILPAIPKEYIKCITGEDGANCDLPHMYLWKDTSVEARLGQPIFHETIRYASFAAAHLHCSFLKGHFDAGRSENYTGRLSGCGTIPVEVLKIAMVEMRQLRRALLPYRENNAILTAIQGICKVILSMETPLPPSAIESMCDETERNLLAALSTSDDGSSALLQCNQGKFTFPTPENRIALWHKYFVNNSGCDGDVKVEKKSDQNTIDIRSKAPKRFRKSLIGYQLWRVAIRKYRQAKRLCFFKLHYNRGDEADQQHINLRKTCVSLTELILKSTIAKISAKTADQPPQEANQDNYVTANIIAQLEVAPLVFYRTLRHLERAAQLRIEGMDELLRIMTNSFSSSSHNHSTLFSPSSLLEVGVSILLARVSPLHQIFRKSPLIKSSPACISHNSSHQQRDHYSSGLVGIDNIRRARNLQAQILQVALDSLKHRDSRDNTELSEGVSTLRRELEGVLLPGILEGAFAADDYILLMKLNVPQKLMNVLTIFQPSDVICNVNSKEITNECASTTLSSEPSMEAKNRCAVSKNGLLPKRITDSGGDSEYNIYIESDAEDVKYTPVGPGGTSLKGVPTSISVEEAVKRCHWTAIQRLGIRCATMVLAPMSHASCAGSSPFSITTAQYHHLAPRVIMNSLYSAIFCELEKCRQALITNSTLNIARVIAHVTTLCTLLASFSRAGEAIPVGTSQSSTRKSLHHCFFSAVKCACSLAHIAISFPGHTNDGSYCYSEFCSLVLRTSGLLMRNQGIPQMTDLLFQPFVEIVKRDSSSLFGNLRKQHQHLECTSHTVVSSTLLFFLILSSGISDIPDEDFSDEESLSTLDLEAINYRSFGYQAVPSSFISKLMKLTSGDCGGPIIAAMQVLQDLCGAATSSPSLCSSWNRYHTFQRFCEAFLPIAFESMSSILMNTPVGSVDFVHENARVTSVLLQVMLYPADPLSSIPRQGSLAMWNGLPVFVVDVQDTTHGSKRTATVLHGSVLEFPTCISGPPHFVTSPDAVEADVPLDALSAVLEDERDIWVSTENGTDAHKTTVNALRLGQYRSFFRPPVLFGSTEDHWLCKCIDYVSSYWTAVTIIPTGHLAASLLLRLTVRVIKHDLEIYHILLHSGSLSRLHDCVVSQTHPFQHDRKSNNTVAGFDQLPNELLFAHLRPAGGNRSTPVLPLPLRALEEIFGIVVSVLSNVYVTSGKNTGIRSLKVLPLSILRLIQERTQHNRPDRLSAASVTNLLVRNSPAPPISPNMHLLDSLGTGISFQSGLTNLIMNSGELTDGVLPRPSHSHSGEENMTIFDGNPPTQVTSSDVSSLYAQLNGYRYRTNARNADLYAVFGAPLTHGPRTLPPGQHSIGGGRKMLGFPYHRNLDNSTTPSPPNVLLFLPRGYQESHGQCTRLPDHKKPLYRRGNGGRIDLRLEAGNYERFRKERREHKEALLEVIYSTPSQSHDPKDNIDLHRLSYLPGELIPRCLLTTAVGITIELSILLTSDHQLIFHVGPALPPPTVTRFTPKNHAPLIPFKRQEIFTLWTEYQPQNVGNGNKEVGTTKSKVALITMELHGDMIFFGVPKETTSQVLLGLGIDFDDIGGDDNVSVLSPLLLDKILDNYTTRDNSDDDIIEDIEDKSEKYDSQNDCYPNDSIDAKVLHGSRSVSMSLNVDGKDHNRWIHVVGVCGGKDMTLFKDGILVCSEPHGLGTSFFSSSVFLNANITLGDASDIRRDSESMPAKQNLYVDRKHQKSTSTTGEHREKKDHIVTDKNKKFHLTEEYCRGVFFLGGLRIWGYSQQPHFIKTIHDNIRPEYPSVLPHVSASIAETQCVTFRFTEGSGDVIFSDGGGIFGSLHGEGVRWSPQPDLLSACNSPCGLMGLGQHHQLPGNLMHIPTTCGLSIHNVSDLVYADEPVDSPVIPSELEIPRQEWVSYFASLDPLGQQLLASIVLGSISAHYSRQCVIEAMRQSLTPGYKVYLYSKCSSKVVSDPPLFMSSAFEYLVFGHPVTSSCTDQTTSSDTSTKRIDTSFGIQHNIAVLTANLLRFSPSLFEAARRHNPVDPSVGHGGTDVECIYSYLYVAIRKLQNIKNTQLNIASSNLPKSEPLEYVDDSGIAVAVKGAVEEGIEMLSETYDISTIDFPFFVASQATEHLPLSLLSEASIPFMVYNGGSKIVGVSQNTVGSLPPAHIHASQCRLAQSIVRNLQTLDSATIYTSVSSKSQLVKTPDSSGIWSEEMQLHHRGWMFLRPSCTGASLGSLSQGSILWPQPLVRVTLKSRSVLAIVGKCVIALLANLGEMEDSKALSECIKKRSTYAGTTKPLSVPVSVRYPFLVFLEGLLNQRVVRSLTHRLHICGIPGNMHPFGSELRNDILIVLTRIFNAWIVFPHISFYDQCPPRLPLERLIATLQSINRKTTTRLSQRQEYLSSISGVHTTLIQHINMLLLAAAKLECSWNCFSIQRKNILDGKPSRFVAESASFVQLAQFSRIANIIRKYYTSALVLTPPPFLSVSEDSPLRQQINTSIPITSFTTERLLSSGPIVDLIPLRGNTGVDSSLFPSLTYCPWRRRPNGLISCSAEKYTTLYSSVGIRKGAKVYFEVRLPYSTGTSIAVGCVTEAYIGNTLMTASKSTIPDAYNFPLGQCNQSWAFDGSRLCRWHNGLKQDTINRVTKWKPRDVIGIRIDFCGGGEVMRLGYSQLESCTSTVAPMMSGGVMQCFHNGKLMSQFDNLEIRTPDVSTSDINVIASASRDDCSHVLYPAITFGTSGCEVNFGSAPFAYDLPPDCAPLDPHHYFMASSLQHQAGTLQTMLSQYVRQNRKEKLDFSSNKIDTETVESTPDKVALSALMTDILQRLSNLEAHIPSNYSTVSSKSVSYLRSGPPVVRLYQPDQYLRCDSCSGTEVFPYSTSMVLRGNACVYSGKWYYEVVVEGEGLFSVGWCTKHYNFSDISATGRGPTKLTLGDDSNSWALDGVRMVLKHNKVHRSLGRHQWKEGDVVGCLLDGEKGTIGFTINGQPLKDVHDTTGEDTLLTNVKISDGMFPAITLEDGNSVCVGFSPKQVYGLKLLSDDLYKKNSDSSGASTLPLSHRRKVGAATLNNNSIIHLGISLPQANPDVSDTSTSPTTPISPSKLPKPLVAIRTLSKEKKSEVSETQPNAGFMPIGFAEPWTEAVLSLFSALEHTLGRYDNTTVIKIQHEKCDLKMISLNRMESAIRAVVDHYEMSLFAQQTEDVLGGCGQICVKGVTDKGESTVAAFPSSLPKDCQILSCEERHLLRLLESLRHCLRKYMPCPTQGPYFPQSNCTATSSFMGQLSQNALYTSSLHLARLQLPTPCITGLYATLSVTNELVEQVKITLNRRSARAALGYHLEGATPYTIGKEDTMRYEYLPQQRLAASLFGQTFSLVGAMSADLFQTRSRLWSVAFTGEGADDVGGPYRECIGGICAELMSDALPLFRATANRRHNVGDFRDRFTVNPYPIRDLSTISARGNDDTSLFTPECSDEPFVSNCKLCINVLMMYEFFGKLIGGCLRSNEPLPLYLSPSIWQYLVSPTGEHHLISSNLSEIDDEDTDLLSPKTVLVLQETTALEDIHYYETIQYFKGILRSILSKKDYLGTIERSDDNDCLTIMSEVDEHVFDGFMVSSSLGLQTPLIQNYNNCPNIEKGSVNISGMLDRIEYLIEALTKLVYKMETYRYFEDGAVIKESIRRGFNTIVPPHSVSMLQWHELEIMVCGHHDYDVDALMNNLRYEGLDQSDQRVEWLRSILKEPSFSRTERKLFAKFISGRERLQPTLKLKIIHSSNITPGLEDEHLPTASTCFFWISFPNYSSIEIMRNKLLFAINQCLDIDADFRVRDGDAEIRVSGHSNTTQEGITDLLGEPGGGHSHGVIQVSPGNDLLSNIEASIVSELANSVGGGHISANTITAFLQQHQQQENDFEDYSHLL